MGWSVAGLKATIQRRFGYGSHGLTKTQAVSVAHRCLRQLEPLGYSRTLATLTDPPAPDKPKYEDELPLLERDIYERVRVASLSAPLLSIHKEYRTNAGRALDPQLPYEPRPNVSRRVETSNLQQSGEERLDDGVFLVAHIAVREDGRRKISLSSGFALAAGGLEESQGIGQCVVTCCHTLEEVRRVHTTHGRLDRSHQYHSA